MPTFDVAAIHWPDKLTPCIMCGERLCEFAYILTNDFDGPGDAKTRIELGLDPRPNLEAFACHERCWESTGWTPWAPDGPTLRAIESVAERLCPMLVGNVRAWNKAA